MALTPFFRGSSSSSSIFDPFPDISIFADSEHSRQFAKDVSAVANTRVDWLETPEAHVFKADLPGLSKEEIKIQVEDGRTLTISGERKEETQKSDKWHRVERAHGSFLRRFRLPENANVEAIKAEVANGVLSVTVPKVEKPKPQDELFDLVEMTIDRITSKALCLDILRSQVGL